MVLVCFHNLCKRSRFRRRLPSRALVVFRRCVKPKPPGQPFLLISQINSVHGHYSAKKQLNIRLCYRYAIWHAMLLKCLLFISQYSSTHFWIVLPKAYRFVHETQVCWRKYLKPKKGSQISRFSDAKKTIHPVCIFLEWADLLVVNDGQKHCKGNVV